jgi:hypothetical protein
MVSIDALAPWLFIAAIGTVGVAVGVALARSLRPDLTAAVSEGTDESVTLESDPEGTDDPDEAAVLVDGAGHPDEPAPGGADDGSGANGEAGLRNGPEGGDEEPGTAEWDAEQPDEPEVQDREAETADPDANPTASADSLDATDEADDADEGTGRVVCEHCGRDDFETEAARNGHLRWCDARDTTGTGGEDGGSTDDGADADSEPSADGTADPGGVGATADPEGTAGADGGAMAGLGEGGLFGSTGGDDATGLDAVRLSADSAARQQLRDGDIDRAVQSAYRSIRDRVVEREGVDCETPRELYRACEERVDDDARLDALEQLVTAYEQACFARRTEFSREEVAALFDSLAGTESVDPAEADE